MVQEVSVINKINQKGQSLLESLMLLPFCIALLSGLLWGSYIYFSNFLIDHWVYETHFCIQKEKSETACVDLFKKQFKKLPFLRLQNISTQKTKHQIKVSLQYSSELSGNYKKRWIQPRHLQFNDFQKAL